MPTLFLKTQKRIYTYVSDDGDAKINYELPETLANEIRRNFGCY